MATLLAALFPAAHADASCVQPAPAIVWSYPGAGATGVPVDADIFLMLNTYGGPSGVTVNGAPVSGGGARGFDPGVLAPDTEHVVAFTAEGPDGPAALELRFTTGTALAPPVGTPSLANLQLDALANPSVPQLCPAVLAAQDCFDTGQDVVLRADATGAHVVLWLFEGLPTGDAGPVGPRALSTWPASCGAPAYVTHRVRFEADPFCLRVTGVGAGGDRQVSNVVCPANSPEMSGTTRATGCSIGCNDSPSGRLAAVGMLAVVGILARRRRSSGRGSR